MLKFTNIFYLLLCSTVIAQIEIVDIVTAPLPDFFTTKIDGLAETNDMIVNIQIKPKSLIINKNNSNKTAPPNLKKKIFTVGSRSNIYNVSSVDSFNITNAVLTSVKESNISNFTIGLNEIKYNTAKKLTINIYLMFLGIFFIQKYLVF